MNTQKVWFVTGASKGLGLTLVKKLLAEGYKVAATSRSLKALASEVGEHSENFLPMKADLVNEQSVAKAVAQTVQTFGAINVVVNNAGYGQFGTLEELSDTEVRQNFDVNVFGSLNVIRSVMPHLREQRSGVIFNISSIGGFSGNFPGWGIYCATKFAVAGFTESLAAEVKEFGITATVVYPGYFRTGFLSKESLGQPQNPIDAYSNARASQAMHENDINGNQMGDPEKAASVLIEIAGSSHVPLHLFLGQDAYNGAKAKMEVVQKEMNTLEKLATSTAFEEVMVN
ncbi:MAG TPA: SDR family oxidoreductase [Chitinophagaceae bacterium]|jgi:NAD(P)-dependent dehydrogenase (short-subunit alcohol dehydrogenase family)|nr:SDR family oxidoreductase [Chitinophagaceae bacterium]